MQTTAIRLYGKKDLRMEEFELPKIKDDEIQQMNLFGGAKSSIEKLSLPNVTEFDLLELLRGEKEFIGPHIS